MTDHPALDRTLEEIAGSRSPRTTKAWVQRLGNRRWLRAAVLEGLVARGTLRDDTQRLLGLFTVTRHPVADDRRVGELRQRVARVLTEPGPVVDPRDAALGALVHSAGGKLLRRLVPGDQRRGARQRAKELSKGEAMSADVAKAIGEANAAAMAAITAAIAASSSSSS